MKTQFTARDTCASLALAFVLFLLASSGFAAEFYTILDDFGRKPRNAYLDVSIDSLTATGPVDIPINIYGAQGVELGSFTLTTSSDGFATTAPFGSLFNFTGGQPILIRARMPDGTPTYAATLHVDSRGAPMTIGVFPTLDHERGPLGLGRLFAIALGDFQFATLLIANVSGNELTADVFKGTRGSDGGGIFSNPRLLPNDIWRVDLTSLERRSNLVVSSNAPIIVQVVIDDGLSIQSFQVLPMQ
jgi:hypothetical protein